MNFQFYVYLPSLALVDICVYVHLQSFWRNDVTNRFTFIRQTFYDDFFFCVLLTNERNYFSENTYLHVSFS